MTTPAKETRLRLRINATAETLLRAGHPWLFASSVREQNRPGRMGELAVVYDRKDAFLAVGLFDPDSPIRMRVLHAGKPRTLDAAWWEEHWQTALQRRAGLFDDRTTGYRLINGESDGWPGLVLDRYDRALVLKLYTAGWLPRLTGLLDLINRSLSPNRLILRLSRNIQPVAESQFSKRDGQTLVGDASTESVIFQETGIRFEAEVVQGQKTGFFLDQRENRRRVETLSAGRTVLNAFSFSGGFSLYAARGGARAVASLDISPHALAAAERNFALNQSDPAVAACPHERIQADAFDWLKANPERKFDLVVLDPPSFAKREAERAGAIAAYGRLATLGLQHLTPGGILVACSCSAHVSAEEFFDAVRAAAAASHLRIEEKETTRHAPDHPARFKEAEYLKAIYMVSKGGRQV